MSGGFLLTDQLTDFSFAPTHARGQPVAAEGAGAAAMRALAFNSPALPTSTLPLPPPLALPIPLPCANVLAKPRTLALTIRHKPARQSPP